MLDNEKPVDQLTQKEAHDAVAEYVRLVHLCLKRAKAIGDAHGIPVTLDFGGNTFEYLKDGTIEEEWGESWSSSDMDC